MAATLEIKYFNTFWIKKMKLVVENNPATPVAPYANVPGDYVSSTASDWYIEESRIRGGYNNTSVDFGVKAYLDESDPLQQHRFNTLIYSGIYNSRTGINNTNQFSVGKDITRSLDPAQGSIQKLYAEDTNLIVFQEDKVSRALIDKDAIYSAEGNRSITSSNLVIGQIVAYAGEYGISKDPFSFAVYGNRKYFTDKKRGVVLRLSGGVGGGQGITEISSYGMHDFFRDELAAAGRIVGGWDAHSKNYILSIQKIQEFNNTPSVNGTTSGSITTVGNNIIVTLSTALTGVEVGMNIYSYTATGQVTGKLYGTVVSVIQTTNPASFLCNINTPIAASQSIIFRAVTGSEYKTLAFDESVLGWTSFFSYRPNYMTSLINGFYSFFNGEIYLHNTGNYATYYNITSDSTVKLVLNSKPSVVKNFKTINYEGNDGWQLQSFISSSGDQSLSITPFLTSNLSTLAGLESNIFALNFKRKENKFFANLQQKLVINTTPQFGEVVYGEDISGVKGFFSTVDMRIIWNTTTPTDSNYYNKKKELFSVSSDVVESSY